MRISKEALLRLAKQEPDSGEVGAGVPDARFARDFDAIFGAPLACKVCGTIIQSAELCEKCAKGNDPFKAADNCGGDLR